MTSPLTHDEQFQALNVLDYLSDLFTVSPKETFTQVANPDRAEPREK